MNKFYDSINFFFDAKQPKTILYIGKIFGEYFFNDDKNIYIKNNKNNINIENMIIKEDLLEKYEVQQKNIFFSKIIGNYKYFSFEEFCEYVDNMTYYDVIFIDTVHYKKYIHIIFKKIYMRSNVIIMHDALPLNNSLTLNVRDMPIPWCGTTYIAIYNLYLHNKDNVYIVDDGFVGYCFINNNNMNFNYELIEYDIEIIKANSIQHGVFYDLLCNKKLKLK